MQPRVKSRHHFSEGASRLRSPGLGVTPCNRTTWKTTMSGTCYTNRLTQTSQVSLKKQCNIDSADQDSINVDATELLTQIAQAFQKSPNLARVLHGDRKIRQGGRGRRTALFPSMKCGGSIPLESRLELAYAVVLERSPSVQEYRTQAIRIRLPKGTIRAPRLFDSNGLWSSRGS